MNDHIGKPFDINHLIKKLREHAQWNELKDNPSSPKAIVKLSIDVAASVAGVELESALSRLGGKLNLYKQMLPMFMSTLGKLPDQLRAFQSQNDSLAASRLLHSLKGSAATLGVTALQEAAAKGEQALKNNPSPEEASALIEHSCAVIVTATPGLTALLHAFESE